MASQLRRPKTVTPDAAKDDKYWERRNRNNITAKRSREKKRFNDDIIRKNIEELRNENAILRWELFLLKSRFGLRKGSLDSSSTDDREHMMEEKPRETYAPKPNSARRLLACSDHFSEDQTSQRSYITEFFDEYRPRADTSDLKQKECQGRSPSEDMSEQENMLSPKAQENYIFGFNIRQDDSEDRCYEPVDLSLKRRRLHFEDSKRLQRESSVPDDMYLEI